MNWKIGLGIGLAFIGVYIILISAFFTGAVIGLGKENSLGIVGVLTTIVGIALMLIGSTLEKKVRETRKTRETRETLGEDELEGVDLKDPDLIYPRPGAVRKERYETSLEHHQAHNTANYQRLKQRYKFIESHGRTPEDEKSWVTLYHAYSRKKETNFSKGFNKLKVSEEKGSGFYMARTPSEAMEFAIDAYGGQRENYKVVEVKISRNVYSPKDKSGIVVEAPKEDKDYYYIPRGKFDKANKLIAKGLINLAEGD